MVIHVFETAVRSKIALILSQNYSNEEQDDWFLKGNDQKLINKARRIADINKINLNLDMSSFEVLDLFTLGDLENLIDSKWSDFKDLFAQPKEYKDQTTGIRHKRASFKNFLYDKKSQKRYLSQQSDQNQIEINRLKYRNFTIATRV